MEEKIDKRKLKHSEERKLLQRQVLNTPEVRKKLSNRKVSKENKEKLSSEMKKLNYINSSFSNPEHRKRVQRIRRENYKSRTHCKNGHELTLENTYTHKDKGYCKVCRKENATKHKQRFQNKNPEDRRKLQKNIWLKSNYGITLEDYNEMLLVQDYKCMICNIHIDEFKKGLHVDHNHTTGKIRGLLCMNCNSMIGHAKEKVENLENGIKYLKEDQKEENEKLDN